MNAETFCEHFATFADAPNGVDTLRALIRKLAVHGKLLRQNPKDEPAEELVRKVSARLPQKQSENRMALSRCKLFQVHSLRKSALRMFLGFCMSG